MLCMIATLKKQSVSVLVEFGFVDIHLWMFFFPRTEMINRKRTIANSSTTVTKQRDQISLPCEINLNWKFLLHKTIVRLREKKTKWFAHRSDGLLQTTGYNETIHIAAKCDWAAKFRQQNKSRDHTRYFSSEWEFSSHRLNEIFILVKCTMFRNELKIFSSCASIFIQLFLKDTHKACVLHGCVRVSAVCATKTSARSSNIFPDPCML